MNDHWGDLAISHSGKLVLYGASSTAVLEARVVETGKLAWTTPIARRSPSGGPMLNPNTPRVWESTAHGLVVVREGGSMDLLDEATGKVQSTGANVGPSEPMRVLARGDRVAVASLDQRVRVFSLPALRLVREARLDASPLAIAWANDQLLFVATADDATHELSV